MSNSLLLIIKSNTRRIDFKYLAFLPSNLIVKAVRAKCPQHLNDQNLKKKREAVHKQHLYHA